MVSCFKRLAVLKKWHSQRYLTFTNRCGSRLCHAIEMFLAEYPNVKVRKRPHHLDGHNYPDKRKSCCKKERSGMNVDLLCETISSSEDEEETENISLNKISDDNWSDLEDETFWVFMILFEFLLYYLSTLKTPTLMKLDWFRRWTFKILLLILLEFFLFILHDFFVHEYVVFYK